MAVKDVCCLINERVKCDPSQLTKNNILNCEQYVKCYEAVCPQFLGSLQSGAID